MKYLRSESSPDLTKAIRAGRETGLGIDTGDRRLEPGGKRFYFPLGEKLDTRWPRATNFMDVQYYTHINVYTAISSYSCIRTGTANNLHQDIGDLALMVFARCCLQEFARASSPLNRPENLSKSRKISWRGELVEIRRLSFFPFPKLRGIVDIGLENSWHVVVY